MTQDELIADTHRLLSRLIEIDEEQRARTEEFKKESEDRSDKLTKDLNERMREKLRERGLPEELLQGDKVDWEKRMKEVQELSKKRVAEAKERQEQYKNDVLNELRIQTDLLNRIAEKLGI